MNGKRIISAILVLCMVLSMLPMGTLAADTITVTAVIPADWTSAYCYVWGNGQYEGWPGVAMTKSGEVWTVEIPSGYENIIISDAGSPQTVDLEMDGNKDVWVTLTTMTVSKYNATIAYSADGEPEPEPEPEDPNAPAYYVTGSSDVFSNWMECNINGKMSAQGDVYVKTFYDVPADEYALKVNDGTWNNSWGDPDGENGNYSLIVARDGSCVTITFDPATETVSAEVSPVVVPEPEPVITYYYVTGSSDVFSNWLEFNTDGKMTKQGGIYVKTFLNVPEGDYELMVNDGTWDNHWGDDTHPNGNYCFSVDGDGSAVTVKFDPATETVSVEIVGGTHGSQPALVDGYYEIYNADQLYWFAQQVDWGNTSINGRLMAYIVDNENLVDDGGSLNAGSFRMWTPIGNDERKYTGTFDGNGKTVSGLYFNNTSKSYIGLFGYVGSGGVVKNVGVVASYFRGDNYVGGVVGENHGTISGCYNTGSVSGNSSYGTVGGVAAYNSGTVSGCYNTGSVIGSGDYVGGVAGSNGGTVSGCYNTGSVIGSGNYVGGVAGRNSGTISICYNTGSVSGDGDYAYTGGVAGYNGGTVTNCYNTGLISGDYWYTGGIVGHNGYSYHSAIVSNCYTTTVAIIGGGDGTVINCYSADEFEVYSISTGEIAYLLQGNQPAHVWGQKIGTDPMPVFSQDRVYQDGDTYANCPGHSYVNGFCSTCDIAQAAVLKENVYEISNAGQLYWFMGMVNGGNSNLSAKLMADITINENVLAADGTLNGENFRNWTPIASYSGTFDGNGKIISGLYSSPSKNYIGLFGEITATGVVKNLNVVDSWLEGWIESGSKGTYSIGAIAGYNQGTVENCTVSASVHGTNYETGGVVGRNSGTVTNCVFTGFVSGTSNVGGLVGNNQGTLMSSRNEGSVSTTGDYVGGVAGLNGGTLDQCYNTGSVTSTGSWIGGVVGNNSKNLRNCYNTGAVTGSDYVGGIAGKNTADIKSCYNTGKVIARSYDRGIVGDNASSNVSDAYYLEGSASSAGGGTAVTAQQLASGEIAYLLGQSGNGWGQNIGTEDLPTFSGNKVYLFNGNYVYCAGHSYVNGFCTTCGTQETPELVNGVYEIYNAAQLYWFAAQVNGGNSSISGKLMADIVVNENVLKADGSLNGDGSNFRVWTPVGYYKNSEDYVNYNGTFDGNGKTISGLYVNDATNGYVGLFGRSSGTIQNVGIVDSFFNGGGYVGGVAATNGGMISGCYNLGTMSGGEEVGGIVGFNVGPNHWVSNMQGGGTVTNCYNGGVVSGNDTVGGVVGYTAYKVSSCYNTGTVSGSGNYVGGVAGASHSYGVVVSNCYNTGSVIGDNYVGGVVGNSEGTLRDCFTTVGSVYGWGYGNIISNCYYLSDTEYSGSSVTAATAVQFASGKIAYLLQGSQTEQIWGQALGTDAFPVLGGSQVHQVTTCSGKGIGYANDPNAALDHSYLATVYDASCLEQGMTLHKCQWCNVWYVENVVDALGHSSYAGGFCTRCDGYEPAVLKNGVYEIYNAGQLYWFAYWVSVGNTAINGKLMNNIVVNENVLTAEGELNGDGSNFRAWTPIGDSRSYAGTFDGNGKTVSGLYCNKSDNDTGMFSSVNADGVVMNLGVVDSYLRGNEDVGGVVCINSGTVQNCYSSNFISGDNDYSSYVAGGVVGRNSGTVTNCYNTGIVNGRSTVGGVVGSNSGIVSNSFNTGSVNGYTRVGGVVGSNSGAIGNSYNTGSVTGSNVYVGGVAGDNTGTISNSYNTGSVSGVKYVGGVAGSNTGYLSQCYYRTGCAMDTIKLVQFGVGSANSGSFTRDKQGQTEGKSAEQFASGEVCYLLFDQSPAKRNGSGAKAWGQKLGTDQVPVFSEHKVYATMKNGQLVFTNEQPNLPKVTGLVTSFLEDGDVTVELLQNGQVKYTTTVVGSNVRYQLEVMEAGTYTLRVSKANHVPVEMEITVGTENVTMDAKLCPKGDVTGDGVVNIKDFQRLLRHVNKTNPLEGYALACGDVTGDGVCNIKDFQRLLRHVNKTNPLF